MNISLIKCLVIISFSLGVMAPLYSVTWYSQSSGIWGDNGFSGIWNTQRNGTGNTYFGSDIPTSVDDVVIQANHEIELEEFAFFSNTIDLNTLTVESGGVLKGNIAMITINVHGSTVTVDGDINSSTLTLVSFNNAAFNTITGAGNANLFTLSFTHTLNQSGSSVSIDLNTTLNTSYYPLDAQSPTGSGTLTLEKNKSLTVQGSMYLDTDARSNYNFNFYNMARIINIEGNLKVTGSLHIGNNNTVNNNLALQVAASGTIEMTSGSVIGGTSVSGAAISIMDVNGTFITAANNPFQNLDSRFGVRMNTGSICILQGGANQQLDDDVLQATYHQVIFAGSGPKLLSGNVEIQDDLKLNTNIQLGNFDLYLSKQVGGIFGFFSAAPATNNSFIETNGSGRLIAYVGGGNVEFPIGNGSPSKIVTTNILGGAPKDYMRMWVENGVNPAGVNTTTNYVNKTWHLEKVTSATNFKFNVQLYWSTADEQSNFDRQLCWVSRYTGSNWDTGNPLSAAILAMNRDDQTDFGAFTIGSAGILPVELIEFKASLNAAGHLLEWLTASELNNSHFEIEHSTNGQNFAKVGELAGNGTTQEKQSYTYIHQPGLIAPIHYYRLKQVDFDGQYEYSDIVAVESMAPDDTRLQIYPSVVTDQLQLRIPSQMNIPKQVLIFSMDGQQLWQHEVIAGDQMEVSVSEWVAGMYVVYGQQEGRSLLPLGRFVKQ